MKRKLLIFWQQLVTGQLDAMLLAALVLGFVIGRK